MRTGIWMRWLLAAFLAIGVASAQRQSRVKGTWEAKVGQETFHFDFQDDQGDVTGTVRLPGGETVEVEYGLVLGKEFEFTTVENGVEFEWTAEVSRNSIKGERVNLDTEAAVRFNAKRRR